MNTKDKMTLFTIMSVVTFLFGIFLYYGIPAFLLFFYWLTNQATWGGIVLWAAFSVLIGLLSLILPHD